MNKESAMLTVQNPFLILNMIAWRLEAFLKCR